MIYVLIFINQWYTRGGVRGQNPLSKKYPVCSTAMYYRFYKKKYNIFFK